MKQMKNKVILILLCASLFLNLLGLILGFTYLNYKNLSVSYAISRVPQVIHSTFASDEPAVDPLKEIILQEYPELNRPDITDYEKVSILRHWAASVVDVSSSSLKLDTRIPKFYTISAYDMYRLFVDDEGGVWCGGTAVFLGKLYDLFGFKNWHLEYGTEEAVTHAVNLVAIIHNGQEIFSLQDAYLDMAYEYPDGEPMDYFTMLGLLKGGRSDGIYIVEPGLSLERDYNQEVWDKDTETFRIMTTRITVTGERFIHFDQVYAFLSDNGLPAEIIYLNLFPYYFYPDPENELLDRATSITGWPIPIEN